MSGLALNYERDSAPVAPSCSNQEGQTPLMPTRRFLCQVALLCHRQESGFLFAGEPTAPTPRKSLRGLWRGLDITEEEIAEARREMWSNLPREDI